MFGNPADALSLRRVKPLQGGNSGLRVVTLTSHRTPTISDNLVLDQTFVNPSKLPEVVCKATFRGGYALIGTPIGA